MRCWSTSKELRPFSSNATTSPSSTAFTWFTISWIIRSSGYWPTTSRPVRVISRVSPVSSRPTARIPSNFGSNRHAGSSNASHPPSASIGCTDAGGGAISGASCALASSASQSVRVFTKWNSSPG